MLAVSWDSAEAFVNVSHLFFRMIFSLWQQWHFPEPGPQCDEWNLFQVIHHAGPRQDNGMNAQQILRNDFRLRQCLKTATQGNLWKQGAGASIHGVSTA